MRESLEDVVELFELAQSAVFKLMASVSQVYNQVYLDMN